MGIERRERRKGSLLRKFLLNNRKGDVRGIYREI